VTRAGAVLGLVALIAGCGESKPSSPPPPVPGWTVESVLWDDAYPDAEGYSVRVDPAAGTVVVEQDREPVAYYLCGGGNVVRVRRTN